MASERVRPSATVILTRRAPELEVFLVERSRHTRFFPGYHAFPGGVLDKDEADSPAARRVAALRELHEETGVLLTRPLPPPDFPAQATRRGGVREAMKAAGLVWDVDALEEAGTLLTPPFGPLRYDTTFYVCELPAGQEPSVDGEELVTGRWWRPADALRAWEAEALPVPPPTLAYLRVLARTDDPREAARLARSTDGRPHHERFHIEMHPGVYVLPLRTPTLPPAVSQNCYLFDGDPLLVVDPGSTQPEEWTALFHTLDELDRDGREGLVVLTHHHGDHVGAVEAVAKRYGFRVLATRATRDALPHGWVDGVVADGHVFDLGEWRGRPWRVEVIATPGHAAGHLVLRDARWGAVFAGDMVSGVSSILVDPHEGDMGDYLASLSRLAALAPPVVFPGHGPLMPGRAFADALAHRRMREEKVVAALREAPRSVEDLVPAAYDDTPQEAWPLAARSLLAHLLDLENRGVAVRRGDGWARA